MEVQLTDGRIKDVPMTEVTAENYIVPSTHRERMMYHCIIEVRKFDGNTGARLSRPRLQKFGVKTFKQMSAELKKQGYTISVVYDPTKYIAEYKSQANKTAQQKQAEAEQKQAEAIEKAVASALAKQEKQHKADIDKAVKEALAKQNGETTSKRGRKPASEQELPNEDKGEGTETE